MKSKRRKLLSKNIFDTITWLERLKNFRNNISYSDNLLISPNPGSIYFTFTNTSIIPESPEKSSSALPIAIPNFNFSGSAFMA